MYIQHIIFSSTCLALTDVFSPGREGAKDVYQAVHQITPHIHMMWFDTIFIPSLSNHTSYIVHHIHKCSISGCSSNHATHSCDVVWHHIHTISIKSHHILLHICMLNIRRFIKSRHTFIWCGLTPYSYHLY